MLYEYNIALKKFKFWRCGVVEVISAGGAVVCACLCIPGVCGASFGGKPRIGRVSFDPSW